MIYPSFQGQISKGGRKVCCTEKRDRAKISVPRFRSCTKGGTEKFDVLKGGTEKFDVLKGGAINGKNKFGSSWPD